MVNITYETLANNDGTSTNVNDAVNVMLRKTAIGSVNSALSDTFYGISQRQMPSAIPINKATHGLTFFTRPRMNMTTANLRAHRWFAPLITTNTNSIPRIIRAYLDVDCELYEHQSPLIDNYNPFISMLTNQLIDQSGWPDIVAPTFTDKEGLYKQSWGFIDGVVENYTSWTWSGTFRNMHGDPITALIFYWLLYGSLVHRGVILPYPDMLIGNELDYNTRIYKLIMDPTKRYVVEIMACGAAFPSSVNIGSVYGNQSGGDIYTRANDQIQVSFQCFGACYKDYILIDEFNRTVNQQNNAMGGTDTDRSNYLVKLNLGELTYFKNRGYPRINDDTLELEWWVFKETYNQVRSELGLA